MRTSITVNELLSNEAVFEIARVIALTDSIGEGYSYCRKYTMEDYIHPSNDEMKDYQKAAIDAMGRVIKVLTGLNLVEDSSITELVNEKTKKAKDEGARPPN